LMMKHCSKVFWGYFIFYISFNPFSQISVPSPPPINLYVCPPQDILHCCSTIIPEMLIIWAVAVIFGYILASNTETVKLGLRWCGTFLLCLLLQMCTSNNTHTSKTQAYRLVIASLLGATPTQTQEHKYKQSISDISSRLL
jgi:hypothetical protein